MNWAAVEPIGRQAGTGQQQKHIGKVQYELAAAEANQKGAVMGKSRRKEHWDQGSS